MILPLRAMPRKYEKPRGTRNYQNYTEETLEKAAFSFSVKTNRIRCVYENQLKNLKYPNQQSIIK